MIIYSHLALQVYFLYFLNKLFVIFSWLNVAIAIFRIFNLTVIISSLACVYRYGFCFSICCIVALQHRTELFLLNLFSYISLQIVSVFCSFQFFVDLVVV